MLGLYTFIDWNGTPRIMRASTIHKKVVDASKKSNYNWITSATDLIYVCTKKNFPVEYAINIKSAVLNCFAVLINSNDYTTKGKKTDIRAVHYAYNSLFGVKNETAIKARRNFLNGFLLNIRLYASAFMFRHGDSFTKVCNDWQATKLNELISVENLNFDEIKEELEEDFIKVIKEAEINGIFAEDDEKEAENRRKIIEESVNHFSEIYGTPDKPKTRVLKPE